MTGRTVKTSPQVYARIAGIFYLFEGLTAVFGQFFILGRLVVHSDAAAIAGPREISLLLWLLVKGVDVRKWSN